MKVLLLLGAFAACAFAQDQAAPACPGDPGVYYLDAGTWKPLSLITPTSSSDDNAPHGMFTWSKKNIVVQYPEAAAHTNLPAHPKFCTSGTATDVNSIFVVKLSEKGDHRELQVGKGTAATAAKVKYRQEDLQPINVTPSGSDALEITPKQDLPPGQYLVVAQNQSNRSDPNAGYDFGVK